MSAPLVVGLDLSLAATGVAHATPGGIVTDTIPTGPEREIVSRLLHIAKQVRELAKTADLVVLEAPSFGSTGGKANERAGLRWMVLERLHLDGRTVVQVSPKTLKVYAVNDGNADKTAMVGAARLYFPRAGVANNNEADACFLAALGLAHLTGVHHVPQPHLRVVKGLRWPVPA